MADTQLSELELRYFVVDAKGQLRPVKASTVEAVWNDDHPATELGVSNSNELRLVNVICDGNIQPVMCYFLRLKLKDERICGVSRVDAFRGMTQHQQRRYDSREAQHQFEGWPANWTTQLAVALDVPAVKLRKVGIGGPMLMSELWGLSLEKVLSYFESAYDESE